MKKANSANVIQATKEAFARHGILVQVISDNGSQYKSHDYRKFSKNWQFLHKTSSPNYPRSNGLAESSVKIVKRMLKKCKGSKQDILKGLLVIRNTPLSCGKSPAELLLGRKLRDNLPEINCQDVGGEAQVRKVAEERQNQKEYHDRKIASSRTRKNVISFMPTDLVAVQHPETKTWSVRGKIISRIDERSYKTKEGTLLRRNIKHIRKINPIDNGRVPNIIPTDNSDTGDVIENVQEQVSPTETTESIKVTIWKNLETKEPH